MTTTNFSTTIAVNKSAEEIYNAVNNVRGWWSEEIVGDTHQLNEIWNYHYQDVHKCQMKIIELIPCERIEWLVLANYFSFTENQSEWLGDKILFEIYPKGDKTELRFTQIGLTPDKECYDICQNAWSTYIQKSLYNLIETGAGNPNSKDQPQTEKENELNSSNFTTSFFVDQATDEVFKAITNVSAWWQGDIKGASEQLYDEFTYQMNDIHYSKQKVVELIPNKRLVWQVTESKLNFLEDIQEWTDTKLVFDINPINNKTQVRFTHIGLNPFIECYDVCANAWQQLIQSSLFSLITTGKGTKVF